MANKLLNITHPPNATAVTAKYVIQTHPQNSNNAAAVLRSALHLVYQPSLFPIHFCLKLAQHTNKPVLVLLFSPLSFLPIFILNDLAK